MAPRVSVVIPAYNVAPYVAGAVRSVLTQTYRDLEVIVVDDGSTDETSSALAAFGTAIRLVRQTNGGVASARNRGAADAAGEILAFLDADDEWLPRKLEVQVGRLDLRPSVVACFVGSFGIDERTQRRRSIRYHVEDDMVRGLARGPIVGNASSVAIRRRAFDEVGGFDQALSQSADWDMWLRLASNGPLDYYDEPLVRVLLGRSRSLSRDAALLERDALRVLEKFFASRAGRNNLDLRSRAYGWHYLALAGSYLEVGQIRPALRCIVAGLMRYPPGILRLLGSPVRRARRRLGGRDDVSSR